MSDDGMEARFTSTMLDLYLLEKSRAITLLLENEPYARRFLILLVTTFVEAHVGAGVSPGESTQEKLVAFVEDASVWITSYLFPEAARKALGK